jgi:hypothetical protein
MKSRVLKKQMKRILNSELPTMFKLSAMHNLIKLSQKSSWFQFRDFPYVRFDRFSTSLHRGVVTVSEHDCIDEIGFSSWHKALTWICKQAKRISEYEVQGSEYIVDSEHYRYRIHFPRNQE